MATRAQFKLSASERKKRNFSENFKKEKVREIELGVTSVSEVRRTYDVSFTSIYRWLNKFGTVNMKEKRERLIVESHSDAVKLRELKKRIAELERTIGQKQLLIDFQQKMIELAEEEYGVDIKKSFLENSRVLLAQQGIDAGESEQTLQRGGYQQTGLSPATGAPAQAAFL